MTINTKEQAQAKFITFKMEDGTEHQLELTAADIRQLLEWLVAMADPDTQRRDSVEPIPASRGGLLLKRLLQEVRLHNGSGVPDKYKIGEKFYDDDWKALDNLSSHLNSRGY